MIPQIFAVTRLKCWSARISTLEKQFVGSLLPYQLNYLFAPTIWGISLSCSDNANLCLWVHYSAVPNVRALPQPDSAGFSSKFQLPELRVSILASSCLPLPFVSVRQPAVHSIPPRSRKRGSQRESKREKERRCTSLVPDGAWQARARAD